MCGIIRNRENTRRLVTAGPAVSASPAATANDHFQNTLLVSHGHFTHFALKFGPLIERDQQLFACTLQTLEMRGQETNLTADNSRCRETAIAKLDRPVVCGEIILLVAINEEHGRSFCMTK
ncbi:hypothetical protein D3C78_1504170 [compost metagenome]